MKCKFCIKKLNSIIIVFVFVFLPHVIISELCIEKLNMIIVWLIVCMLWVIITNIMVYNTGSWATMPFWCCCYSIPKWIAVDCVHCIIFIACFWIEKEQHTIACTILSKYNIIAWEHNWFCRCHICFVQR